MKKLPEAELRAAWDALRKIARPQLKPNPSNYPIRKGVKAVCCSPRWRLEYLKEPRIVRLKKAGSGGEDVRVLVQERVASVYIAPSGRRYLQRVGNEPCDLIMKFRSIGIRPAELTRYEHSAIAKRHERFLREQEGRHAEHKQRSKAKKQEKRAKARRAA